MNKFQTIWKQLAATRALTSSDMAVMALSKAIHEEERLKKADSATAANALDLAKYYLKQNFKPITKPIKLANGAYPHGALYSALWNITRSESYKAFSDLWGEETRNRIKELSVQINGKRYGEVNL
jgi:hypothetical protein